MISLHICSHALEWQLKDGLASAGLPAAPWELRDMMKLADKDGNNMIDHDEFANAYGSMGWEKTKDLGRCGMWFDVVASCS